MQIPSLQLTTLIVVIVASTQFVAAQWCTVWGDPHVVPYPTYDGEVPPQLFCQTPGTKTILKNKFVEITATINASPYYVQSYVLTFKKGGNVLCTFTDPPATSPFFCGTDIVVTQVGGSTIYTYAKANFVANIQNVYYMMFWLPFASVSASTGMCVIPGPGCTLEGKRRKRVANSFNSTQQAVSDNAAQICQAYVDAATSALNSQYTVRPQVVANVLSACIQDLQLTGDQSYATSIGVLLASDIADQSITNGDAAAMTNSITQAIPKAQSSVSSTKKKLANRFPATVNT